MLTDGRALADDASLVADLCIVGAGAAGITLALAFLGTAVRVCLLESGGLDLDAETQALYAGENAGRDYYPLDACRLRFLGGTTNHWGGRSRPLSVWDFAPRPWVPHSGWPIGPEALEPYYRRAQEICGLGPFAYGPELWDQLGRATPALDPERLQHAFWRYSRSGLPDTTEADPVRFGQENEDALRRAANVQVVLHANLLKIGLHPDARTVAGLEVATLAGNAMRVRASAYVLACGAIENARLLLVSDDVEPHGVGNRHDLVGRFFMEHPDAVCGLVQPGSSRLLDTYAFQRLDGRTLRPGVQLAPALQARERALGCSASFAEQPNPESATVALRRLYRDLAADGWPDQLVRDLTTVLADLDGLVDDSLERLTEGEVSAEATHQLRIAVELEQAPNPESRVTLAVERDALGLRRPRLAWQLTGQDRHSMLVMAQAVAAEITRLSLGRVRLADWLMEAGDGWAADMHGSYHHLGTTRMADDPRQGVTDRDGRVHGIDNLYLAGGSLFPTGGSSNPTLTIVALALRQADHLHGRLVRRG